MSTAVVETRTLTTPPDAIPSIDPYLVRGLLWCQPCGTPMAPGPRIAGRTQAEPELHRTYGCASCDLKILANAVEEIVWKRATARANIGTITPAYRQSILHMMVNKLILNGASTELGFLWRI